MEREGLFIDTRQDKKMSPNPYFHSVYWDIRRDEAALFIQRIVRGMLARMRAKHLLLQKEQKIQAIQQKVRHERVCKITDGGEPEARGDLAEEGDREAGAPQN